MKPVMLNGLFVPREPAAGFRLWECKAVLEYQRSLQNGRGPVLVFQPVRLRANCQQLRAEFREEMAPMTQTGSASGLPRALPNVMMRFPCELNPQMIVRGKDNEPFLHQSTWPRSEILAQIGPH